MPRFDLNGDPMPDDAPGTPPPTPQQSYAPTAQQPYAQPYQQPGPSPYQQAPPLAPQTGPILPGPTGSTTDPAKVVGAIVGITVLVLIAGGVIAMVHPPAVPAPTSYTKYALDCGLSIDKPIDWEATPSDKTQGSAAVKISGGEVFRIHTAMIEIAEGSPRDFYTHKNNTNTNNTKTHTNKHATSRFIAWMTHTNTTMGAVVSAQANPVGSTTTRVHPSASAAITGVLLATAPSIRDCPPMRTGGNAPGIAQLAMIASAAGPDDSSTDAPVSRSVAATCTGMTVSCSCGSVRWRAIRPRKPLGSSSELLPVNTPSRLRADRGNRSRRRGPHQIASSRATPAGVGSQQK